MELFLWNVILVLSVVAAVLFVRLYLMQKSAREIKREFEERLHTETNTLIDISSCDKSMRQLAASMNRQLAALREERQRYQQGDIELREAVTNISHDLRTPLTAICGYLDLLDQVELDDEARRYVSMVRNRTEALKELTEELFRYSIILSVEAKETESLSLQAVLEESILSFYGAMKQQGIEPDIHMTETRVERLLNRPALSRIFANIISNAIKYSDGDFFVTLSDDGTIVFANTAKSLKAVDVAKLFDRFVTVETGRGGTGLGLSIAKVLTERMGGSIAADYVEQKLRIVLTFKKN